MTQLKGRCLGTVYHIFTTGLVLVVGEKRQSAACPALRYHLRLPHVIKALPHNSVSSLALDILTHYFGGGIEGEWQAIPHLVDFTMEHALTLAPSKTTILEAKEITAWLTKRDEKDG